MKNEIVNNHNNCDVSKNRSYRLLSLSIGVYIIIVPFLFYFNTIFYQEWIIPVSGIYISLISILILLILNKSFTYRVINLSVLDIGLFSYVAYSFLNGIIISQCNLDYFIFLKWITLLGLYILIRLMNDKTLFLICFAISGILQSLLAFFQKIGEVNNTYSFFKATGSFVNPANLGGFLSICIIVTICLLFDSYKKNKSKGIILVITISLLIQLVGLLIADSRASIVALILGVSLAVILYFSHVIKRHKMLLSFVVLFVVIIGSIYIYNYRKDSADGRLLIWNISLDMISEKPVLGHGLGQFGNEYMLYQAKYFENYPESRYVSVADNVEYTFNEFLHVAVEQGMIGIAIILFILLTIFNSPNGCINNLAKCGVVTWIGFSLFSYPTDVFPIMFLFIILIACIKSRTIYIFQNKRLALSILSLLFAFFAFNCFREACNISRINESILHLNSVEYDENDVFIVDNNFDRLKYNPTFNNLYFHWFIAQDKDSVNIDRLAYMKPSCELYCFVGKIYEDLTMYDVAEKYYRTASFMIPNRINPNYNLWELYMMMGEFDKADVLALKIMHQYIKVESSYTLRIKAKVRNYLKNRE